MTTAMTRLLLLLITLLAVSASTAVADSSDNAALFEQAHTQFEAGDFETALPGFEQLVEREPANARYHLWLGKCYGRVAERSNWIKAAYLANKTHTHFETAVALDDSNVEAIEALREFYLQAPGFLGGSQEKAEHLAERLRDLEMAADMAVETPEQLPPLTHQND